jgi:hypothetical protein
MGSTSPKKLDGELSDLDQKSRRAETKKARWLATRQRVTSQ